MTLTAAERKAAERARHKEAGRVAVTVHIYADDREKLAHYIKRLNERAERRRSANVKVEADGEGIIAQVAPRTQGSASPSCED